jgi:ribosome biogenesis protein ENP2
MKVTSVNNVKIYNVNTGRSVPQWISEKKKRKLLKDDTELRQVGKVHL